MSLSTQFEYKITVVKSLRQGMAGLISWCLKAISSCTGPGLASKATFVMAWWSAHRPEPARHPHAETTSAEHVKRKLENRTRQVSTWVVVELHMAFLKLGWKWGWPTAYYSTWLPISSNSERIWSETPREHHKNWYTPWQKLSRSFLWTPFSQISHVYLLDQCTNGSNIFIPSSHEWEPWLDRRATD